MARNAQDINPDDVFPRRNLPGEAESWGRTLEDRVIALEKGHVAQESSLAGANRTAASALANTANQINSIVRPQMIAASAPTGFDPSETSSLILSKSLTVPSGFRYAVVFVNLSVQVWREPSSAINNLHIYTEVDGVVRGFGNTNLYPSPSATIYATATAQTAQLVVGLTSGDAILLEGYGMVDPDLPAHANNSAYFQGTVLWFN